MGYFCFDLIIGLVVWFFWGGARRKGGLYFAQLLFAGFIFQMLTLAYRNPIFLYIIYAFKVLLHKFKYVVFSLYVI